jgi:hypothetical protein
VRHGQYGEDYRTLLAKVSGDAPFCIYVVLRNDVFLAAPLPQSARLKSVAVFCGTEIFRSAELADELNRVVD